MRLKKIYIQGFGNIRDLHFPLEPGFNLFFGANNTGKSTIMNFILQLLYGQPGEWTPDDILLPLHVPGDGMQHGEIQYEKDDGSVFSLSLEQGSQKGDTRAVIRDLSTGSEILSSSAQETGCSTVPGEYHLGIPRNIFEYTSLFEQSPRSPESRQKLFTGLRTLLDTSSRADPLRELLEEVRRQLPRYGEKEEARLQGQIEEWRAKIRTARESGNGVQAMDPDKLAEIRSVSDRIKELSAQLKSMALVDEAAERNGLEKNINRLKEAKSTLDRIENRLIELSDVKSLSAVEQDRLTELLCRKEDLGSQQESLTRKLQEYRESLALAGAPDAPQEEPSMPSLVATMVNLKKDLIDWKSAFVKKIYELGMQSLDIIGEGVEKERRQTKQWLMLICCCFIVLLIYGLWQEKTLFIAVTTILPILLIPVFLKMKNTETVLNKLQRSQIDLEKEINRWKDKEKIEIAKISTSKIQELLINHRGHLQRTGTSDAGILKKLEKEITNIKKQIGTTEAKIRDILVKSHAYKGKGKDYISFESIDAFIAGKAELFDAPAAAMNHSCRQEIAQAEEKLDAVQEEYREVCANIDSILQALGLQEEDDLKERMDVATEKARLEEERQEARQNYNDVMTEEPEVMIRRFETLSRRTGSVELPDGIMGYADLRGNQVQLKEELLEKKEAYGLLVKALQDVHSEEEDLASAVLSLKISKKQLEDFLREKDAWGQLQDILLELIEENESSALIELNRHLSQTAALFLPHNRGELMVNENYEIRFRQNGAENTVALEHLGCGYLNLAALALQFAVQPMLNFRKEKMPLLLDECLAFCDDEVAVRVMDYLVKASEERQVLFFTCKGRERDYLEKRANQAEGVKLIYLSGERAGMNQAPAISS